MKLCLLGDSQFTRAVRKKAEAAGIEVVPNPIDAPVIVDVEVYNEPVPFSCRQDIDKTFTIGMSCCAEAVLNKLGNVEGKHVCIVGRGHAVKGLEKALIVGDATVTVCHSKTKSVKKASKNADILVVAAPVKPFKFAGRVIDVAGHFGGEKVFSDTTDVIIRRVHEYYREFPVKG